MKKNEVVQMLMQISKSDLRGRKLTRYLCANMNILSNYINTESKLFEVEVMKKGFDIKAINNIQLLLKREDGQSMDQKIASIPKEDFEYYTQFENFRLNYFDAEAKIDLIPIPERLLPKFVSLNERLAIESLIKIPRT